MATALDEPSSSVSFVLVSELAALRFNPRRTEPLIFNVDSPKVNISITSGNTPGTPWHGYDNLECKATCVLATSTDVASFVDKIAHGEYLPIAGAPVTLPVRVRGEERIDAQGKLLYGKTIPFEILPPAVQELWMSAHELLTSTQARFLRLLRWGQDLDGAHRPYDGRPSLYWRAGNSPDKAHYATRGPRSTAALGTADVRGGDDIVWETAQAAAIRDLWDLGTDQPIAHELLCEARRLAAQGSDRGALLVAATAVETGVKDHIGRLRPHTQWILNNLPSPPIHKLLRKYIPEMHSDCEYVSDWKFLAPLWKRCVELTEARNGTAHVGALVDAAALEVHLETAADILYVLDVLAGNGWARRRVSQKLRTALGWPAPTERRLISRTEESAWEIDPPA